MKSWFESLLIALSMYSILPVKCMNWTSKNLRHALVFFPGIGLVCMLAIVVIWVICRCFNVSNILFGILAVTGLVFVTGGIHLDGFCDTADALFSRRTQEEKLRILKDPNCGPFAVFSVILVLMVMAGAFSEIFLDFDVSVLGLVGGGFVISRCMNGFAQTTIKCTSTSSLAKTFGSNAAKPVSFILAAEFIIVNILLFICYGYISILLIVAAMLVYLMFYRMQKNQFGGLTGDLVGFMLTICETIWCLLIAVFGGALL